jgi:hypothetical protein
MPLPLILTAAGASGVLATAVKWIVGYSIVRVIAALGIGLVTFSALDTITGLITNFIESNTSGIGGQFWEVAVVLNVPHAIKVVTSAYAGAVAIRQLMGVYNRVTFGKSK